MLKKRRGEIATLLTLGLVILGGVLAIGSSVFLSQQKTTSIRAAGDCPQYQSPSGDLEVGTPDTYCSISSSTGRWNRCNNGGYIVDTNCENNPKKYANNQERICYNQNCCNESTGSNLNYTFNETICGEDEAATQLNQQETVPAPSQLEPDPECMSASGNYAWGPSDGCYILGGSWRGSYCANKKIGDSLTANSAPCCAVMPNSTRLCCSSSMQSATARFLKEHPDFKNTFSQKADIYGLSCKDEILKSSEAVAIPPASDDKPRDRCDDYGSALACSKGCRLEEGSYLCVKGKVSGEKKWCCSPAAPPPAAPPPAATNTCLDQNKKNDGFEYKCTHKIYGSAEDSCQKNLYPQNTYSSYPSLKCGGDVTSVCCRKSGSVGGQVTASACETVKCSDVKQGTTGEFAKRTFTTSNSSLTKFYPDYQKCNLDTDGTNTNVGSTFYEDRIIDQVCIQGSQTGDQPAAAGTIPGVPVTSDSRTCIARNTVFENQSDILESLPCYHVLVKSSGDTNIFRECPNFVQGTSCVYSCYKGEAQVNCQGTYDLWTTSARGTSVTVINNTGFDLSIKGGTTSTSPQVLFNETVSNTQYVQGFINPCHSSYENVIIIYEGQKSGSETRKVNCGSRILINLK